MLFNHNQPADNVKLIALINYEPKLHTAHALIEVKDIDNEVKVELIPSSLITNITKLKEKIVDMGHPPVIDPQYWKDVADILSKPISERIKLVKCPGYVNGVYLTSDETVIGGNGEIGPRFIPNANLQLPIESQKGSFEDWQKNVAPFALHSSRLMLALCLSFAGLVIRFSSVQSGGFHLFGKSSTGKSTGLLFAGSVFGDKRFIKSWAMTPKALEEISTAHNDSLLILDELYLAHSNENQAARLVKDSTFLISEGKVRSRSNHYEPIKSEWFLQALSAGENSLLEHAKRGKQDRALGETVRFIDVPADAGKGMGIYESLPEDCNSPSQLATQVQDAIEQYYGSAKTEFLHKFLSKFEGKQEAIKQYLDARIRFFLDKKNVNKNSGTEDRIAKRFGLVYATGMLCIKLGILPFEKKDVFGAISSCYDAYLKARPLSEQEQVAEALGKIACIPKKSTTINLIDKHNTPSKKERKKVKAFITKVKKEEVLAIESIRFKKLITDDNLRQLVLKQLSDDKALIRSKDHRNTRQVAIPWRKEKPRCICIKRSYLV